MKPLFRLLLVVTLAQLPLAVSSAEELLFERSLSINRSNNIFDTDEFDLDLILGDQFFTPTNPITLFDDLLITPTDVDRVVNVIASDAPFDIVARRITDAENEFLRLIFAENKLAGRAEQRGWQESHFFLGTSETPDLAGATIHRISLRIDRFTLLSEEGLSGSSAASLTSIVAGPPVDLQLTLSIYGAAVPEPGGVWLLGSGLATLLSVPYRYRRWGR